MPSLIRTAAISALISIITDQKSTDGREGSCHGGIIPEMRVQPVSEVIKELGSSSEWGHLVSGLSSESRNQTRQLVSTKQEMNPESHSKSMCFASLPMSQVKISDRCQTIEFSYLEVRKAEITST